MARILKIEPYSGMAGDMFIAAGAPLAGVEDQIIALPALLGLDGVTVEFTDVMKCSIRCRKMTVCDPHADEPASPEKFSKHNHSHEHGDEHSHSHDHSHAHDHGPGDGEGEFRVHHRGLTQICGMIDVSQLDPAVKTLAKRIFHIVGEAEAEVHDLPIDDVHFHEVGAVDSIIDILGAAIVINALKPERVYCEPICTGHGFVWTDHGRLPVPAPATERILRGMPTFAGETASELITPTGAAIIAALDPIFGRPVLRVERSANGAGTKEFNHPNAVRLSLCSEVAASPAAASAAVVVGGSTSGNALLLLQTNIDDMPAEQLGADFLGTLLEAGALDAWLTPVIMKKGRSGVKLEVLCPPNLRDPLCDLILEQTATLGVRIVPVDRKILEREMATVETEFGPITVKVATTPSGRRRAIPEYEDCRAAASKAGVPVRDVYLAALKG